MLSLSAVLKAKEVSIHGTDLHTVFLVHTYRNTNSAQKLNIYKIEMMSAVFLRV